MRHLKEVPIEFLKEEQSQLWEEIRHNDRLRWYLFAGWIVAQATIAGHILQYNNPEKIISASALLVLSFLIGPLVMIFHGLERNKSTDFTITKDLIRHAIFRSPFNEKFGKKDFVFAWKGTDGIYTYLLSFSSSITSTLAIYLIIETGALYNNYLMLAVKSIILIVCFYLLFFIYSCLSIVLKKILNEKKKYFVKCWRPLLFILFLISILFIAFHLFLSNKIKLNPFMLYNLIPLCFFLHLSIYGLIQFFGNKQYSRLTKMYFNYLKLKKFNNELV